MMKENVQIIDYQPLYKKAFKELNQQWIEHYFTMEKMDYKVLDNPEEYVLNNGGYIAIALLNGKPVGTCALMKSHADGFDYELAKMGVSPKAQGHGIGYKLGLAIIQKAKSLGASNIFIESNTVLKPAINLYKKLGFIEIEAISTPYDRCNIQMELKL